MVHKILLKPFVVAIVFIILIAGCGGDSSIQAVKDFEDLGNGGVRIAIGEPNSVPAGSYAMRILDNLTDENESLKTAIENNIVTEEPNVRAVLDKVTSKEVDAGFVYLTDAFTVKENVEIIEIPENIQVTAIYPIGILNESNDAELAKSFVDYVMSKDGMAVLEDFWFTPVGNRIDFNPKRFDGKSLVVYAAASMTDAFEEIAENFKATTGAEVKYKFASSGSLRQLIENGAVGGEAGADVFASASLEHMEALKENGFIEDFITFTHNKMVIVVPK
ncbi:MAG: molybdate ABC transporter substrate-binding protein [Thermoanaerobacterales bacterium]|jgi:molybdate transport system substrate-binding protein|nr:molybdate ABC transporter substrate-binding protein [Thermoanaerobacterales bacterium]